MTIDEWCPCSICARRRQQNRSQWYESLVRLETNTDEGQSAETLTEEDYEVAAYVFLKQRYGLGSLKSKLGKQDVEAALERALEVNRSLHNALDRYCAANGWLPYDDRDLFLLINRTPEECLVTLVSSARETVRVMEEAGPSAELIDLAREFLAAAEQVELLIEQRALINREPTEERLHGLLWTLLDWLHLLDRSGSDREIIVARSTSARIYEQIALLRDELQLVFANWETLDFTPPVTRSTAPRIAPDPNVQTSPPRQLAQQFVERLVSCADGVCKIVGEERLSAEAHHAARQLVKSITALEGQVHREPAPEV